MEPVIDVSGIYTKRRLFTIYLVATGLASSIVWVYAPEGWGPLRTLLGGAIIGAIAFLSVFVNHLIIPPLKDA